MYALQHAIKAHCMLALLSHLGLYVSLGLWAGVEATQLVLWFAPGGAGSSHPSKQLVLSDARPWLPCVPLCTHPPVCTGLQLQGGSSVQLQPSLSLFQAC